VTARGDQNEKTVARAPSLSAQLRGETEPAPGAPNRRLPPPHQGPPPRRKQHRRGGGGAMADAARRKHPALRLRSRDSWASPRVSTQTAPQTASGPIAQLKPKPKPMANQRLPPTTRANVGAREPEVSLGEDATSHTPHPIAPQGPLLMCIHIYIYIHMYLFIICNIYIYIYIDLNLETTAPEQGAPSRRGAPAMGTQRGKTPKAASPRAMAQAFRASVVAAPGAAC
jgi:hypothetical protein